MSFLKLSDYNQKINHTIYLSSTEYLSILVIYDQEKKGFSGELSSTLGTSLKITGKKSSQPIISSPLLL